MKKSRTIGRRSHWPIRLIIGGAVVMLAVGAYYSGALSETTAIETFDGSLERLPESAPATRDSARQQADPLASVTAQSPHRAERHTSPAAYSWAAESERDYIAAPLAQGLVSPDGIAIHPLTGAIYVSEEDAWAISRLTETGTVRVIDRDTPIYCERYPTRARREPMRFPEGMAFSHDGHLYVVEDIPGGRLLRFTASAAGRYEEGVEVPFPGHWNHFAWEGLDINADGEILIAGSDLEHIARSDSIGAFTGVILYRDPDGIWWVPQQRFFASYSSVAFSPSGRQAVYTCEVTGEIGWLDLNSRFALSGHSHVTARSPEGLAILPDGTLMIAEETGSLLHLDPATDQYRRVVEGLSDIESVIWDERGQRLLVTEDGSGTVWAFTPDRPFAMGPDRLLYATYYPAFAEQTVPDECPGYLARILALGGLRFDGRRPAPVSFREFLHRVPLVAADLQAVSMNANQQISDPVERVQFVVFEPNRMMRPGTTGTPHSFALFAVQMRSGELITTSALPVISATATAPATEFTRQGLIPLAVPMPAAVSVSGVGIAAVQFAGMGRTPDYSLVLNPRNPADSYMVVFHSCGQRDHYRLESASGTGSNDWVISYKPLEQDYWTRLGTTEEAWNQLAYQGGHP